MRPHADEQGAVVRTVHHRGTKAFRNRQRELRGNVSVNNKVLVLGGGVAGSSIAYYLTEKGYDVTVVEKNSRVGGLARTCYYAGHPYEFGPHIWFWPGGEEDPINNTIVKLTNNELFHVDRRLFTYVEADRQKYRYPVHYQDIDQMPERETIYRELNRHRDSAQKLIEAQLPELGRCTFADYFTAAIGQTLYQKFMANYTWKMWNIPGDELQRQHDKQRCDSEEIRDTAQSDELRPCSPTAKSPEHARTDSEHEEVQRR